MVLPRVNYLFSVFVSVKVCITVRLRDTHRAHLRGQFCTGKKAWILLVCRASLSQVNKPQ